MARNLKALGLALMALLALSALASSVSAQAANGRLTSTGNVTLTGVETSGFNALTFTIPIECPNSTYTGHKFNVTPHTLIPSGSETATVVPNYNICKSSVGPSTIDLNGCDYVMHLGETTGVADTFAFTTDIICPAGKDITVTNWFSEAEHKEGKEACVWHIAPQTGLKGGTLRDTTEGDLTIGGNVQGIKLVETKDGLHPLLCPAKEGTGQFDDDVAITGVNGAGSNTAISLSHL